MTVERFRLFVAVDLPREHLDHIERAIEPVRGTFPDARWISIDNQHVTLKFLGPTPSDRMDEISKVCEIVGAGVAPASLSVTQLGSFPSRTRVRVLWVGLDDPHGVLARLAKDLESALEPLGYPAEERAFTAHLTLARLKAPQRLPDGLPDIALASLGPFEVGELVLYRSHLSPKGARYEALERFPLHGG